jgi:hypothetical protein
MNEEVTEATTKHVNFSPLPIMGGDELLVPV